MKGLTMGGRHSANRKASHGGPHRADAAGATGRPAARAGTPGADVANSAEAMVEQHRAGLLAYVVGLTRGDRAHAQDIVKETLYRVAQDPARLMQRPPSVRAWLTVVARGVFDEQQRRRPEGSAGLPADPRQSAAPTTILRAMDSLSEVHRDILMELFYRGTSLQDAAATRGVPVETVKSRLYYAMRALRVVLDQQVP